jgi:hypothetical protein
VSETRASADGSEDLTHESVEEHRMDDMHTENEKAWSRKETCFSLRLGVAAACTLLAGCGTATMNEAARQAFAKSHAGCQATVRERPDLGAAMVNSTAYEVTGCNSDVIYSCQPRRWESYTCPDGSSCTSLAGAECRESSLCTPDGCDSFELAARNALVKDKTCPLDRVTAAPHATVLAAPAADVAADPERMRMWTQAQREQIAGHTFMAATGCGSETVYDCRRPYIRVPPVCVPAGAPASTPSK